MAEKHTVNTAHGTLQFEGAIRSGQRVVLVTLSKPFFPPLSFCLSPFEALVVDVALQDAIADAGALELPK